MSTHETDDDLAFPDLDDPLELATPLRSPTAPVPDPAGFAAPPRTRPPRGDGDYARRLLAILGVGVVGLGLALGARAWFEGAGHAPPGIVEYETVSVPAPGDRATVARYEWERAQMER